MNCKSRRVQRWRKQLTAKEHWKPAEERVFGAGKSASGLCSSRFGIPGGGDLPGEQIRPDDAPVISRHQLLCSETYELMIRGRLKLSLKVYRAGESRWQEALATGGPGT